MRNSLNSEQVEILSSQICDKILSHPCFTKSKNIAIYYPIRNEVNLLSLINTNEQAGTKTFVMPVVMDKQQMTFKTWNRNSELKDSPLGIPEPQNGTTIEGNKIDLCLLPLVGYHKNGSRLGYGGGYYDRFFSNKNNHKTILAGVAYDFQIMSWNISDDWDVPLDYIFTNKEIIEIKK